MLQWPGAALRIQWARLAARLARSSGGSWLFLKDLILDHVDWLDCSSGSELAREVEVMKALATGFGDDYWSDRVSLKEEIVKSGPLLEEM